MNNYVQMRSIESSEESFIPHSSTGFVVYRFRVRITSYQGEKWTTTWCDVLLRNRSRTFFRYQIIQKWRLSD